MNSDEVFRDGEWQAPTKKLVLHVEVPGIYVEDVQDTADEFYNGDVGVIVLEEMMRREVGLTFVSLPGEKEQNSDFNVDSRTCKIVGAEVRDAEARSPGGKG